MEALQEFVEAMGSHTIEEIETMPEGVRAELINGCVYMMGSPTPAHQQLIGLLYYTILNHIKSNGGTCTPFVAPCAVFLDSKKTKKQWVEPDVFVICNKDKIHSDGIYGAPDWIIEVTSPSTIRNDFTKKVTLYQDYGVKEYWIVNPAGRYVSVFTYFPDFQFTQYSFDSRIIPSLYPDLIININDLLSI
ncbi:MAG: Uma2 family endonuclease [Blautia sp.]|nr:Uma2 family endonuclease [Blautia sp.]